MIYLVIVLLLLFLSFRYDINGKTKGRDQWYLLLLVVFVLIAGLRYRIGTDTTGALDYFFKHVPTIDNIDMDYISIKYPFWYLLNSLVYTVAGKFYVLQLVQATIVNVLFFKYIRKHSDYLFTSLFFYFLMMYIALNTEELKASLSVAVCLFANDYIYEKKWAKGILLYFIGCMFHFSTWLLFLIILLLPILKMNKWGVVTLIFVFVAGFVIQKVMGDYLYLLEFSEDISDKAEGYTESEKYGENQGLRYFIKTILPTLLYSVFCYYYVKKHHAKEKLLRMEPFLLLSIMCLLIQANIPIFYRYYRFFEIYGIFFFSFVFVHLIKDSKQLSIGVSTLRSFAIFIPFFVAVLYGYKGKYYRYYPYYSVIERKIDKKREMKQREYHPNRQLPSPNKY